MPDASSLSYFKNVAGADGGNPEDLFPLLTTEERVLWALRHYDRKVVVSSSFGVQSPLMLQLAKAYDVPVISVDIRLPQYDAQRDYRDTVQRAMGFKLHIFPAHDEGDKVRALREGLGFLGAKGMMSGIRASQTDIRAQKLFIESRGDVADHIHPLLDWPDSKADYYLGKMPREWLNPDYKPGVRSKGGVILPGNVEKTECGIHGFENGAGI